MNLDKLKMQLAQMPQADCPVQHHFSDGLYARELFIPAGTCIVGSEHLTRHLFIQVYGEVAVSVNGTVREVLNGYEVRETLPGTRKAFYAIKDSLLLSFHVTDETDVRKIGEAILKPERDLFPAWHRQLLEDDS
jgi:hypothetical protein